MLNQYYAYMVGTFDDVKNFYMVILTFESNTKYNKLSVAYMRRRNHLYARIYK